MLPDMILIQQKTKGSSINSIKDTLKAELAAKKISTLIKPGMKIGITVGSRGIACLVVILTNLIKEIKKLGGKPQLIAAMGSHGNGTKEGRLKLLAGMGITEKSTGVPVQAGYEGFCLGTLTDNTKVFINKIIFDYDMVILLNRIKPHTSFTGDIESGLVKMAAVGLGGTLGAEAIHSKGVELIEKMVLATGEYIIDKIPNLLGIGVLENSGEEIHQIKIIDKEDIIQQEKKLLKKAKSLVAILPFKKLDLLVVDEIGKNFSGTGMDAKIIGRFRIPGVPEPEIPDIKRIVVLNLSEDSHGNANGIGLADFTTQKLVDKIDFKATYLNAVTTTFIMRAMLPLTLPDDREAITWAIQSFGCDNLNKIKIARITNTLNLSKLWVSENMLTELDLEQVEILSAPKKFDFDSSNIIKRW